MFASSNDVILILLVFLTYFDASCSGYNLLPYSDISLIRDRRQAACSDCFCPAINLANGEYEVLGVDHTPGDPVPESSVVRLTCNADYALHPRVDVVACLDGNWTSPVPECKKTCPARVSQSVEVSCTLQGLPVDCSERVREGTVARSRCQPLYTQTQPGTATSTCSAGSWDAPLTTCTPVCGEVAPKAVTHIIIANSANATKGDFPWHVGLYRHLGGRHEYQCGGSIITPLIVLTAAHCFTNELGTERFPAQEYYVAAGKYYSDYDAAEDNLAQTSQVKDYYIPPQYRGYESNFAGDLAVVVLVKEFQLSKLVRPVCVDWENKIESQQLRANSSGSVVGWGYVDPNKQKASVELKQLNAPYIDIGACLDAVPSSFRRWVTPDKFCAGLTNGSSVCKGDSGGGMVFAWREHNTQRFYLRGLASVGPVTKGVCDIFQYGVYTRLSAYYDFIRNIVSSNPVVD